MAISCSDDDCVFDTDSELDKLQECLGPKVPIFERPKSGYCVEEVFRIISGAVPQSKLCIKKPSAVRTFSSFVIDLTKVRLKDLSADDNGVWITSTPRRMYEVERRCGEVVSLRHVTKIVPGVDKKKVVTICRQYGTHQATPEFKRIIATVLDHNGVVMPKAIVQYFFLGGNEVPVQTLCHGNSKVKERPYYRTQPSTLEAIKEESRNKTASVAYNDVFEAAGGIDRCESISEEPRNKMQVYNARKNVKDSSMDSKDDIFDLLSLLKEHQSIQGGGFLREVLISSTLLAFDKQFDNIVTFCCQSSCFSVFGVDATFELGDFYVTLTTYRNLFLTSAYASKPPVLLGPAFIHMERQSDKYHSFFASLLKLQPQISALKAYGTDGEKPLVNALETCFPDAIGLRCFIHKRKNIEEHLKGELLSDIFGTQEGEVFSTGLVDKESEEAFDVSLGRLYKRWEKLAPGFHKWFLTQQAVSFRRCMILPVRERAHLGSPPLQFTNNPNESSNSVVKHWVGFKKNSWPDFV